jgi:hypothetical protein
MILEVMIREAIKKTIEQNGVSIRRFCLENGLNYGNFNNFLRGGKTMSLEKIEHVLKLLCLKIVPSVVYLVNDNYIFFDYEDLKNKYPDVPEKISVGTMEIRTNDIDIKKIFLLKE